MGIFDPDDKEAIKWKRTRQMGKWRYILFFGVIGWGLPWAVIWTGAMWLVGTLSASLSVTFATALVTGLAGGFIFGLAMWSWGERGYRLRRAHGVVEDDG